MEPVLFRIVILRTDQRLLQLATRVTQPARSQKKYAAQDWIHELTIDIASVNPWDVHLDKMLTVIIHAHCLRAFQYHRWMIRTSLLCCLVRITGSRLRSLSVVISSTSEECIPLIGKMDSLEYLAITFDAKSPPSLVQAVPISLPHVQHFSFHWVSTVSSYAARFLFSCQFEQAVSASVVVTALTQEFVPEFLSFIVDRDKPFERLSLNMPATLILFINDGLLRCTDWLEFVSYVPPNTFLNGWSRSSVLRSLSVCTPSPPNPANLQPLLESLASADDHRFEESNFSLIITIQNGRFSWDLGRQDASYGNFIGALVYHARVLRKRGIQMVDEKGYTLFD
jgi:hypothetical protein